MARLYENQSEFDTYVGIEGFGLAQVKQEGMASKYDEPNLKPWKYCGEEFDEWFLTYFEFKFGTQWLKPIVRKFAAKAWDAGVLAHHRSKEA